MSCSYWDVLCVTVTMTRTGLKQMPVQWSESVKSVAGIMWQLIKSSYWRWELHNSNGLLFLFNYCHLVLTKKRGDSRVDLKLSLMLLLKNFCSFRWSICSISIPFLTRKLLRVCVDYHRQYDGSFSSSSVKKWMYQWSIVLIKTLLRRFFLKTNCFHIIAAKFFLSPESFTGIV